MKLTFGFVSLVIICALFGFSQEDQEEHKFENPVFYPVYQLLMPFYYTKVVQSQRPGVIPEAVNFLEALVERKRALTYRIHTVYDSFELTKSGLATQLEIKFILMMMFDQWSPALDIMLPHLDEIFQVLDENVEGHIPPKRLKQFLRPLLTEWYHLAKEKIEDKTQISFSL